MSCSHVASPSFPSTYKLASSSRFSPSAISRRTMTRTANTTSARSNWTATPTSSSWITTTRTSPEAQKILPTQSRRRACSPSCAQMSIDPPQRKELAMANQQPTYQAYTVVKREGQDDFWLNIGAAWMHQDGDGFNIVLSALPLNGKIVL